MQDKRRLRVQGFNQCPCLFSLLFFQIYPLPYSDTGGTLILRTSPNPTGGPNPTLETYRSPSGPNVIAVGRNKPSTIGSNSPESVILTTRPVKGVGNRLP